MDHKNNKIAEQSKKWLMNALLSLMDEKPFRDITITEISNRADLARRTFYRNFKTKDEVLSLCVKEKMDEYIEYGKRETDFSLQNITRLYFTFWQANLKFAQVLKKNGLLFMLLIEFSRYLPYIHEVVQGNDVNYGGSEELSYAMTFGAGGFWNLLSQWLEEGAVKSPDEMAKIAKNILTYYK